MTARRGNGLLLIIGILVIFQAGLLVQQQYGILENPLTEGSPSDTGNDIQPRLQGSINLSVNDSRGQLYSKIFEASKNSVVSVTTFSQSDQGLQQAASGSGFVYDNEGHIVTNNHVIDQGTTYEITLLNGNSYNAQLVGSDPYTDLAVLKVEQATQFSPLQLSSNGETAVGHGVLAIGNPFGLSGSMTHGIVSQTDRLLPATGGFSIPNVIQTDAAVNPGNSGGPLLNLEGEVIGVNTAIDTRTRTFSGVGFAVSVDTVRRVVPTLVEEGEYDHPWIGVSGVDVTPAIAEEMDLQNPRGFLVLEIQEDSPAEQAGVQAGDREVSLRGRQLTLGGDVIVGIDDEPVRKINDILNYLARETSVGDQITLTVIRNGQEQEIDLTLAERPAAN